MLLGLLIALGPLAWVRWRNRGASPLRRLQALTVLTLFLTFDLVLFGAFTRADRFRSGLPRLAWLLRQCESRGCP